MYHLGFDDLPNELKLHTLKYALTSKKPLSAKNHPDLEARLGLNVDGLFLTNKAMHALAAEVYYSSNTFIVERSYGTDDIRIGYDEGNYSFHYPPSNSDISYADSVYSWMSTRTIQHPQRSCWNARIRGGVGAVDRHLDSAIGSL